MLKEQKPKTRNQMATDLDIKNLLNLPNLYPESNKDADFDYEISLVVHDVQKDNDRLKDVEEHRTNRQTFERLTVSPKLNIWKEEILQLQCNLNM